MAFNNDEYRNRYQELGGSDFEIADGEPDIRGWSVKNSQGETLGDVDELIFDIESRKVRYIVLDLDNNELDLDSKSVLVPIGIAELDEEDDDVILPDITAEQLKSLPEYDGDGFSQETELQIRNVFGGAGLGVAASQDNDFYNHDHFNDRNLYKNRSRTTEGGQTVLGIFDSSSQAQSAIQRLRSSGFEDTNIDIADRSSADVDSDNDSSMSNFFNNLFGNDDEARSYSEIAKHSAVVTVHAQSREEAQRAAEILDEYGSVDIQDRSTKPENRENQPTGETSIPIIEEELQIGKKTVETGGTRFKSRIIERPVEQSVRLRS